MTERNMSGSPARSRVPGDLFHSKAFRSRCAFALAFCCLTSPGGGARAQIDVVREVPCCDLKGTNVIWVGEDPIMTFEELASYCGPILWFSPDEPLLRDVEHPADIDIPAAFPFQEPAPGPVIYYRVRTLISTGAGSGYTRNDADQNRSTLDLSRVTGIDLDYFFYYPSEEGLGGHEHDVEAVEMKLAVLRQPDCEECRYGISIQRVIGKAHGILWYDNTLDTDYDTSYPIHVLVEEGKHASCTDKNGDGYYTPGYDVNTRVNDAWGVRDVMRTGALFTGGFQSWLAKVRHPPERVFPPLPEDSPHRERYVEYGVYAPGNAKYSVRPYPRLEAAEAHSDPKIVHFVDKGYDEWPELWDDTSIRDVGRWLEEENFVKSLSIALRIDNDVGVSFVFPLLIVKGVNEPVGGGWLVNRLILKDVDLRDVIYNVLYTPSASRWIDAYFALGVEFDQRDDGSSRTMFNSETGLKFRFNIAHSPFKFLTRLTDFWGFRFGVRYVGFGSFSEIGYAVEIGAGTF